MKSFIVKFVKNTALLTGGAFLFVACASLLLAPVETETVVAPTPVEITEPEAGGLKVVEGPEAFEPEAQLDDSLLQRVIASRASTAEGGAIILSMSTEAAASWVYAACYVETEQDAGELVVDLYDFASLSGASTDATVDATAALILYAQDSDCKSW